MKTTFTQMQQSYEAAANALLARRNDLRNHLKQVRHAGTWESALAQNRLERRIDLLTTEYGELCSALRSIRQYAALEVQQQ